MSSFFGTVIFSLIMGISIFISLPIVLRKKRNENTTKLLEAVAIGILIFLIADVFSDVTPSLYKGGALYGYGAIPLLSLVFALSLAIGFFMLYFFENRSKKSLTPTTTALMIAMGIGLQNLTEGLVFGAASASIGLFSGIAVVVLVGFSLQNVTEGFPIASPFINKNDVPLWIIVVLFLIGGIPTVLGGVVGFFYSSTLFNVFFDGLAIGSILYVILPMIKALVRDIDPMKKKLAYIGIFAGFLLGFLVNLI
jgi:zinc transporter, ZIP family